MPDPELDNYKRKLSRLESAGATPPAQTAAAHSDDIAVDQFAAAMKAKLAAKRAEGRGGWDDKNECSNEFLSLLLREHVDKGDPLDVMNFAMMIHQRGERIHPDFTTKEQGAALEAQPITLTYTNYRGETSQRTIKPKRVWFGSTEWHPEPQWLLTAFDVDKGADRDFALKDFGASSAAAEELKAEKLIQEITDAVDEYRETLGRDTHGPKEWPTLDGVTRAASNRILSVFANPTYATESYQKRVAAAHHALFHDDPTDITERNARALEQSMETAQAFGMSRDEAMALVDYTFSRPVGDPRKELGAKILTAFSLGITAGIDVMAAAEDELQKMQQPETIARIRAKRATRHGRGPLPGFDPSDSTKQELKP
ncbi:hypothetical protein FB480_101903 [Agrobacterium vitis]|nr:hypothetical protein FB480_101903 [Agrobacterium vitis]